MIIFSAKLSGLKYRSVRCNIESRRTKDGALAEVTVTAGSKNSLGPSYHKKAKVYQHSESGKRELDLLGTLGGSMTHSCQVYIACQRFEAVWSFCL
jgi:hypothetical protein